MSFLQTLLAHKFKTIAITVTSAAAIALGTIYGLPKNTVEDKVKDLSVDSAPKKLEPDLHPQPKSKPPKPKVNNNDNQEVNFGTKLATLKQQKNKLVQDVSTYIASSNAKLKGVRDVNEIDQWLKACKTAVPDYQDNISEDEKTDLKNKYNAFKSDINTITQLQKDIESTLKTKEDTADKQRDGSKKQDYQDFEDEYNKLNKTYTDATNKKSDEVFSEARKALETKLTHSNTVCNFKDMIQTNDRQVIK